jgi:hypothetical protein
LNLKVCFLKELSTFNINDGSGVGPLSKQDPDPAGYDQICNSSLTLRRKMC